MEAHWDTQYAGAEFEWPHAPCVRTEALFAGKRLPEKLCHCKWYPPRQTRVALDIIPLQRAGQLDFGQALSAGGVRMTRLGRIDHGAIDAH
jgi:hypothetical protein